MEVNNKLVDQMLVTAAAQTPAGRSAEQSKDADRPDFDSMVHQKRSVAEKGEPKAAKPAAKENAPADVPEEEKPVADEQFAIAAAMMFQAQPDVRYTAIQTEAVPEIEAPEAALETLQAVSVTETPETLLPAEDAAETPAEAPAEAVFAPAYDGAGTAPVGNRGEDGIETAERPEPGETPELELSEEPAARAPQTAEPGAPRSAEAPEAPRFARAEGRSREENDAGSGEAQAAPEAPVFDRVEAAPVKVAEAPRPIPLEAEDGVEQLGETIDGVLVNSADADRIVVTLTPETLGKLTVEITRGEGGALSVVLNASNERTANLLERHTGNLQGLLMSNERPEVQVQVRASEEAQQQFLNPDDQNGRDRQQQQQRDGRRPGRQHEAQDFLQQLRLGLVDMTGSAE